MIGPGSNKNWFDCHFHFTFDQVLLIFFRSSTMKMDATQGQTTLGRETSICIRFLVFQIISITPIIMYCLSINHFHKTRPKPAYGWQGLEWDCQVRIQFRQVHFGVDTYWENIYFWKKYPWSGFHWLIKCDFHETTLKNDGNQPKTWKTMETHQKPWKTMELPWNTMVTNKKT